MKTLIINANVFDGINRELKEGVNILVENNLIKKISREDLTEKDEVTVIDAKGKTIIPGLIDCHYHIMLSDGFKAMDEMEIDEVAIKSTIIAKGLLERGFTTIREVGGSTWGLHACIEEGVVPGPRIYQSGPAISQTAGHSDYRQNRAQRNPKNYGDSPFLRQGHMTIADGVPECLETVRDQFFKGATQIKVMGGGGASSLWDPLDTIQYTKNELEAIVETAKNYGTYVCSHLHVSPAMKMSIEAGVKCIEHGSEMSEEVAKMMVDNDVWLCSQYGTAKLLAERKIPLDSELLYQKTERVGKGLIKNAEWVKKYGIKSAFGSDVAGTPEVHENQLKEFPARKELFGSFEGIKQATSYAAELLGLCTYLNPYIEGKIGVVEEGAYADLLIVEGNPVEDLDILGSKDNILMVMKDGKVFKDIK